MKTNNMESISGGIKAEINTCNADIYDSLIYTSILFHNVSFHFELCSVVARLLLHLVWFFFCAFYSLDSFISLFSLESWPSIECLFKLIHHKYTLE